MRGFPTRRPRKVPPRPSLAAVLLVLTLAAACDQAEAPDVAETTAAEPGAPAPAALRPAGRAEILAAVAAAADATGAGLALPEDNRDLANRSFELRLPFACNGQTRGDWWQWSFDPQGSRLQASASLSEFGDEEWVRALGPQDYDSAAGIWIERPWIRSEGCPASAFDSPGVAASASPDADPDATGSSNAPAPQTVALVQFFRPDAPRTLQRRMRPFAYTGKWPEGSEPGREGMRLVIRGRIGGFPDGQPVKCLVREASRPPVCAVAVEIADVSLEEPTLRKALAVWHF